MTNKCEKDKFTFVKTVNNWQSARVVFSAFVAAHPELGLKDTPVTYRNFCFRHGRYLLHQDVMRKPYGIRSPAIIDVTRFDQVAFDLLSRRPLKFQQTNLEN